MRGFKKRALRWLAAAIVALIGMICAASALSEVVVDQRCAVNIALATGSSEAIPEAEFKLYRVAEISSQATFTPTEDFRKYADFLKGSLTQEGWQTLAEMLPTYIAADGIAVYQNLAGESCIGRTDEMGALRFSDLETGLYLVVGTTAELNEMRYAIAPTLISLPDWDANLDWEYERTILPKTELLGKAPVNIWVQKNWEGDRASVRPESITVQLWGDGELVEEVLLNKENNWQYQWKELAGEVSWSVIENPVPDGYTPAYSADGELIIITNSREDTSSGNSKLPQTGLLWWPVPMLVIAGMLLFAAGWKMAKRNET